LLEAGLYIGVNGCSLKTAEQLEVIKTIPLDRMMLETDAPWCGVKRTHAGHGFVKTSFDTATRPNKKSSEQCMKDRCEPCHIVHVAEVVAAIHDTTVEDVAGVTTENARKVFFPIR
jgi:TatD DNase family protein